MSITNSHIFIRNVSSLDHISKNDKIILKSNLSSEENPMSVRNITISNKTESLNRGISISDDLKSRTRDITISSDRSFSRDITISSDKSIIISDDQDSVIISISDNQEPRVIAIVDDQEPRTNLKPNLSSSHELNESGRVVKVVNPTESAMDVESVGASEDCCHSHVAAPSLHQTLNEMDFERGIWNAALHGDNKRVSELIKKGVNPSVEDLSGYTALHYAARNGHSDVCQTLMQAGANINAATRAGKSTPLHRAALAGQNGVVELLLKAGCNPGLTDNDGRTALHRAVEHHHAQTAIILLSAYPEAADLCDNQGKTPAQRAQGDKDLEIFFK